MTEKSSRNRQKNLFHIYDRSRFIKYLNCIQQACLIISNMFAPEINLSHCQKTWEDKPLLTLFCVGYYCIDLYFRRAQIKGIAAIPCRIYVYWIYRQPKGWKTAYCRARWYQNPSHYRLKEKYEYRKPRPTRLISEFAYFSIFIAIGQTLLELN